MIVIRRKLIFGLILMILAVSFVSASDVNTTDNSTDVLTAPAIPDTPDKPDLVVNETVYITPNNIDEYFADNTLTDEYDGKTFIFEGNFNNLGKISIDAQNVVIKGQGAVLKNIVFDISKDNVSLSDLKFDLDSDFSENDGAAILFTGNNLILDNLDINYVVPLNTEAYAIYGVGEKPNSRNFRLTNSRINFEGHNNNVNVYNCAVKVINYEDSLMENNTITTALPLKDVNHGAHGTSLNSDFVLTVGVEGCDNLKFIGNEIITEVNYRQDSLYPTLDAFMISQCDNALIANNSIHMSDFITYPGLANYLYGLDIYNLNNLSVVNNDITILTTGGRLSAGTAYPIQVSGPITNVSIIKNSLYSFSNGPNIGVYSQNYYGSTELIIKNNIINVTGLAGTHEWALVAGIETQDSNSVIEDNIIEVHSVGPVSVNDNIYGVSYRQSTQGDHKYTIQNNTVFSDGYKSVYLLGSKDSKVANNLLVSYNENAKNGYDGFGYGDLSNHDNLDFENNQVIRAFDYFAGLNNNVDNGDSYSYTTPTNKKGISNVIDGRSINPVSNKNKPTYNPLIPGKTSRQGGAYVPAAVDSTPDSQKNKNDDKSSESATNSKTDGSGGNSNSSSSKTSTSTSGYASNNTDATPSDAGSQSVVGQSESGGGSSSVSKNAFELEDLTSDEFIPSIFYVIAALVLLVVGYRRKKSQSD